MHPEQAVRSLTKAITQLMRTSGGEETRVPNSTSNVEIHLVPAHHSTNIHPTQTKLEFSAMTIIYQTHEYSNFNTGCKLEAGEWLATGIEFERLPLPCISTPIEQQASKTS